MKPDDSAEKSTHEGRTSDLPPHPRGRPWNWRHIVAAKRSASGCSWREIAGELKVRECTAKHYTQAEGWSVLFGHFRAIYLAELEDSLLEPALNALVEILTTSKNEFARLQAVSLIMAERTRTYGRIDKALKTTRETDPQNSGSVTVVDNTIQAPDDDSGD